MATDTSLFLHWADFLVFAIFLLANIAIGLYQSLKQIGKTAKSTNGTEEYFLGGRTMNWLPTAVSLVMSFLSANIVVGGPAQIFYQGAEYSLLSVGFMLGNIMAAVLFIPLFYPLKISSVSEYIEERFGGTLPRLCAVLLLFLHVLVYSAMCLYTAVTALESATGYPEWAIIIIIGAVITLYSAAGGLKGTTYASTLQALMMVVTMLIVTIKGSIDVGGIVEVGRYASRGSRLTFFNFEPNIFQSNTTWGSVFAFSFSTASMIGLTQMGVQRYCSVPTLSDAKKMVIISAPSYFLILALGYLPGFVLYAWYTKTGCDPLRAGYIDNANQILPYYLVDRLGYPGLPGFILSGILASSMGATAGCLGAMAIILWENVLKKCCTRNDEKSKVIIVKILVAVVGLADIGATFVVSKIGGNVIEVALTLMGVALGPLLGLCLLGALFPCANRIGAVVGSMAGLSVLVWLTVGSIIFPGPSREYLTTLTENCTYLLNNQTDEFSIAASTEKLSGVKQFYQLSFFFYTLFGALITVTIGLTVTMFTGCSDPAEVDPRYFIPIFDIFCCCLPNKTRHILRCGIVKSDKDNKTSHNTAYNQDDKQNCTNVGPHAAPTGISTILTSRL